MVQAWMRWCRLCAREDRNDNNSHINVLLKDEEGLPFSDTIYQCFSIDIKSCNNFPNMICNECFTHIGATINLNQRLPRVNALFTELLVKNEGELDLNKVKARHNLECDFQSFNCSQLENIEINAKDKHSEKELSLYQNITLNHVTMNMEEDDVGNCDNLSSLGDESSNDSSLPEKTNETDKPKEKNKYKSRKRRQPEDKTKSHHCTKCLKGFIKLYNYRQHMLSAHGITIENKRSVFTCGKCGKGCKSVSSLKEHEFSHSEQRTFKCKNCEKAFKTNLSLKQHEDTHNETRYICVVCGLQLNTQQTLRKHMVVHSDEKNYKCDYCGNEYKRAKALKTHLILHTGLKPYTCDFCEKSFANVSNCRGHKKKHHPVELAALEACGKNKISATTVIPKLNELKAITASKPEIIRPNNRCKDKGEEIC